jgi:serine/threonine protein phosphatase PrpC
MMRHLLLHETNSKPEHFHSCFHNPRSQNKSKSASEQRVCVLPDVTRLTANVGEYLLLACDGIFDKMTNEQARSQSCRWHSWLYSFSHERMLKRNLVYSN